MGKTINVRCKNTGKTHKVPMGFTLEEVYEMLEIKLPLGVTSAKVNNKVEGLHFMLFSDKDVEFLDISSPSGRRTYTRSVLFVLYKAVTELYPGVCLRIEMPVSNGYYCRLTSNGELFNFSPDAVRSRMQEIIDANLPFHRVTCPSEEALLLFSQQG